MSTGSTLSLPKVKDGALDQTLGQVVSLNANQIIAREGKVDNAAANSASAFLNLPSEIRLLIYEHYFNLIDNVIKVRRRTPKGELYDEDSNDIHVQGINACANMVGVCCLVRLETSGLFQHAISTRNLRFCMAPIRAFEALIAPRHGFLVAGFLPRVKTVQFVFYRQFSGHQLSHLVQWTGKGKNMQILCEHVDWSVDSIYEDDWTSRRTVLLNSIGVSAHAVNEDPRFEQLGMPADVSEHTVDLLNAVNRRCETGGCDSFKVCIQYRLRGPISLRTMVIIYELATAQSNRWYIREVGPLKSLSVAEIESLKGTPRWEVYD